MLGMPTAHLQYAAGRGWEGLNFCPRWRDYPGRGGRLPSWNTCAPRGREAGGTDLDAWRAVRVGHDVAATNTLAVLHDVAAASFVGLSIPKLRI